MLKPAHLIPLLAFAMAAFSACDPQQGCQSHYSAPQEINACLQGYQDGTTYASQVTAAGHGGSVAGAAGARPFCTSQCKLSYPPAGTDPGVLGACIDSCQATAQMQVYASPSN